jgi:hypothetical protein
MENGINMKVAILISGQPRNFEQGYAELKAAYLDRYDCDVFFHTWQDTTFKATQFFHDRPANEYTMEASWNERLLDLYKPKRHLFEEPKVFDNKQIIDPIWRQPLQNSKSMWYSVHKAFSLVDNSYDVYIRTRFDLRLEPSLLNLESLDLSKIHVWDWNTDERVKHRGVYDVFAVGGYTNIGIYSSVFPRIDWYLQHDAEYHASLRGGWPGQDSGLRNEYLLRWHLYNSGVRWESYPNTLPHADGHIIR